MEETAASEPNTPTAPETKGTPKKRFYRKPTFIISIVALILIVVTGVGIYFWQQGIVAGLKDEKSLLDEKVASQSAQIAKVEKGNKDFQTKINFLEKSLKEATASAQFEFGDLTIASVSGKHFVYEDEGGPVNFVLVDVSMKNDTEQTLFLSTLGFKLKDANNKSYPQASTGTYKLPSGKVLIFDQQMAAGETVSGSVVFSAPKTVNLFTLIYENQERTITVK
ncbi:MAG: DUF4352 domain-containing protein [Candidatus Woykebacteria bacterium]